MSSPFYSVFSVACISVSFGTRINNWGDFFKISDAEWNAVRNLQYFLFFCFFNYCCCFLLLFFVCVFCKLSQFLLFCVFLLLFVLLCYCFV